MATTTRAVLVRRAVDGNGVTFFEFAKQVLNNGTVVSTEGHILSVPPAMADGSPPNWNYIKGQVDTHLGKLGFGATTTGDWGLVTNFVATVVTPDVVQAYITNQAALKASVATNNTPALA